MGRNRKSNENEVALFFRIDEGSFERLKNFDQPYLQITQSETNAATHNGGRVTLRVRRTENIGGDSGVLFEHATKYRLPMDTATLTSKCVELEKAITEDEYAMALPFGERLYQKRRFLFSLTDDCVAELDWYVEKEKMDFGYFCKLDINTPVSGLKPAEITRLLKLLPNHGIVIADLVNPPWVRSANIKNRITALMEKTWNLA